MTALRLCLYLLLLAGCGIATAANDDVHVTQLRHRVWRLSDGAFSRILAIAEGPDGYLWVGTETGLLRFDGVRFTPWSPPSPHPAPDIVGALLPARDGAMWIATHDGVGVLRAGKFADVPLGGAAIQSLFEDHAGTVWAVRAMLRLGQLPLCSVSTTPVKCYGPADGLDIGYATGMTQDADGYFWIGSGVLVRWKPGSAQVPYFQEALKSYGNSRAVTDIETLKDGSILASLVVPGSAAGMQTYRSGQWHSFQLPGFDGSTGGGRSFMQDRDGAFWVSPNTGGGLVHVQNGRSDAFNHADGLSDDRVRIIFQDHEGTVWTVTEGGLDSFSRLPVVTYGARDGVPLTGTPSVVASPDGAVVGFGRTPFTIHNGIVTPLPGFDTQQPGGQVYSALIDTAGNTWIGKGNHIYRYRDHSPVAVKTPDGSDSLGVGDIVPALIEGANQAVWGLISGNHRHRIVAVRPEGMTDVTELPGEDVDDYLTADLEGDLWAGGVTNRLQHFSLKTRKLSSETIGFADRTFVVLQMFVDAADRLWMLSDQGLRIRAGNRWTRIDARNGLPCEKLESAILGKDQTLWIASDCGLMRIRADEWQRALAEPGTHISVRLYGATDGFLNPSVDAANKVTQTRDGRIWFSGREIQTFDPSDLDRPSEEPPVHIESLVADRRSYELDGSRRLPPNPHEVELDYTAPSSMSPQATQFMYRRASYDQSGRAPDTRRQAIYTDLPPGHYRFEVALGSPQGPALRSKDSIEFSIAPAFYQTSWFRTAAALIVLIAVWAAYRARLARLTSLLRLSHRERLLERESIARDLHDTFFQSVQSIMLRVHTTTRGLPEHTPARVRLEEVLDDADQVMLEGRQLMLSLRAETNRSMTLAEALAAAGEHLATDHPSEFKVSVIGELRPLLPLVFEEVRFFGLEALSNAFRHAKAALIEVEIHYARNEFRLRIRDDGIGINPEILGSGNRPNHWGIPGLRERAAKVAGRMEIWSRANAGTEIQMRIPARAAYGSGK